MLKIHYFLFLVLEKKFYNLLFNLILLKKVAIVDNFFKWFIIVHS